MTSIYLTSLERGLIKFFLIFYFTYHNKESLFVFFTLDNFYRK